VTLRCKCFVSEPGANRNRYKLNIWDVGGQKTLRSYWRNYFEKTDALIWVVDATDRLRIEDCRDELKGLLLEEV
jgi:ADP-ribosylation factor-like protein 2